MARAFNLAGAQTKIIVFRNHTNTALEESLHELKTSLNAAQILALSGGFSAVMNPMVLESLLQTYLENIE